MLYQILVHNSYTNNIQWPRYYISCTSYEHSRSTHINSTNYYISPAQQNQQEELIVGIQGSVFGIYVAHISKYIIVVRHTKLIIAIFGLILHTTQNGFTTSIVMFRVWLKSLYVMLSMKLDFFECYQSINQGFTQAMTIFCKRQRSIYQQHKIDKISLLIQIEKNFLLKSKPKYYEAH